MRVFLLYLFLKAISSEVIEPTHFEDGEVEEDSKFWRIAFGSCDKEYLPQSEVWSSIERQSPHGFVWLGDAGYPNCTTTSCVAESFEMLSKNEDYNTFKLNQNLMIVDGVWDDHDYGLNDGGSDYINKEKTQQLFLDFLEYPEDSPLRTQKGLYHSIIFGESPHDVHLILLDTRFHKETVGYTLPSQVPWLPFGSHLASIMRWMKSVLGIGTSFQGDLLGEEQWTWLRQTLQESDASVTLIASSIQVLTNCPVFESWGHHPASRERLFELVQETNPKGLMFLSGDVHFGQILGDPIGVLELTSSGLTHSILTSLGGAILTDLFLPFYGGASAEFLREKSPMGQRSFYEGKNFGLVDVEWDSDLVPNVTLKLMDYLGNERIVISQILDPMEASERNAELLSIPPLLKKRTLFGYGWRLPLLAVAILWPPQMLYCLIAFYVVKLYGMGVILKNALLKKKTDVPSTTAMSPGRAKTANKENKKER